MPTFRIHLIGGRKVDVDAADPKAAAAAVQAPIAKIKRVKTAEGGKADRPSRLMARPVRSEARHADSARTK